jgi:hypothetical protein
LVDGFFADTNEGVEKIFLSCLLRHEGQDRSIFSGIERKKDSKTIPQLWHLNSYMGMVNFIIWSFVFHTLDRISGYRGFPSYEGPGDHRMDRYNNLLVLQLCPPCGRVLDPGLVLFLLLAC